jgi:hypothetical protein
MTPMPVKTTRLEGIVGKAFLMGSFGKKPFQRSLATDGAQMDTDERKRESCSLSVFICG